MQGLEHLQDELVVQGKQIRNITARVKRMEYEVSHMKTICSRQYKFNQIPSKSVRNANV